MAGDVKVAVVTGQIATGATGTADFTKADFGTPKAAIIIITRDSSDGSTSAVQYAVSIGFTDFTDERFIAGQSEDGAAKENADCRKGVDHSYYILNSGGDASGSGNASVITDGVQLTNDDASGGVFATVVLFGGADLDVKVGSHVLSNNSVNDTNATTTGIDQDIVFFIGVDRSGEDSTGTGVRNSFGVASTGREASQSIANQCQGFTVDHGNVVGAPIAVRRNARCLSITDEGGGLDWGIRLSAADVTSFTTTIEDKSPGSGMEVYYLALALSVSDGRLKSEIGSVDGPVVSGDWSPAPLAFTPQYVGLGISTLGAINSISQTASAGAIGISHNTGSGEEGCHSWYDEDATDTINTNNCFRSRAIYLFDDDGSTIAYDLSHSSFNSDGWTYSQVGTPSATASKWFYWAIEEAPAAGADIDITVPVASLTITTFAPTQQIITNVPVQTLSINTAAVTQEILTRVPSANLTLISFAPTILQTFDHQRNIPTQTLSLDTFSVTQQIITTVPTQTLSITTFTPIVVLTANIDLSPASASFSLSTAAPNIQVSINIVPSTASLILTTTAPIILVGINIIITPNKADLTLATVAPSIINAPDAEKELTFVRLKAIDLLGIKITANTNLIGSRINDDGLMGIELRAKRPA